jgi:aminoglycoside phosphotransferase (APT) family kinase protein
MAIARQRDPATVRAGLSAWLGLPIDDLTQPSAGGLSSETYLFRAGADALVARLAPDGAGLFPSYDLNAQALVMQTLAEQGVVPVPRVVAYVDDDSWLGAPFIVMERVAGRVPTDQPSYLTEGWVHDAPPTRQRALHDNFLDVCARIHSCDWDGLGLAYLARPGGTGIDAEIAWWTSYLDWAADGAELAALREALGWCEAHAPTSLPTPSLCWGDVRIPNVVFDDQFVPRAVLDWEMASIGPAELDLGWFVALHRMSVEALGADLPGFPSRTELLASYEARLGRPLVAVEWFEAWAAFRSAAILVRLTRLLRDLGLVDDLRMQERNPSTKLLAALVGAQ